MYLKLENYGLSKMAGNKSSLVKVINVYHNYFPQQCLINTMYTSTNTGYWVYCHCTCYCMTYPEISGKELIAKESRPWFENCLCRLLLSWSNLRLLERIIIAELFRSFNELLKITLNWWFVFCSSWIPKDHHCILLLSSYTVMIMQ